jgi:hypothetical protein
VHNELETLILARKSVSLALGALNMQTALAVYQPAVINFPENLCKGIDANSFSPLFEVRAQNENNSLIVADIFSKSINSSVISYVLDGNMRDSHYLFGSDISERRNALNAF